MNGIRLPVRLLGVPLRLDPSFLLILPLLAWLIASQVPAYVTLMAEAGIDLDADALTRGATPALLGLGAAIGLFVGVVLHELGHVLAARLFGHQAEEITLWFLGGMARFRDLPRGPGAEALVALAGPVASFAVAFASAALIGVTETPWLRFLASYLAIANGALGIFNLLPAMPLDGGRILRSLLAIPFGRLRATQASVVVSRGVAIAMGVWGFLSLNLLLVVLAFFVYQAGTAEGRMAIVERHFEGRTVRDLMTPDPATVPPDMPLSQFARLREFRAHSGYPVVDAAGRLHGFARVLDVDPLEDADGEMPADATVARVMRDAETIAPDEPLLKVLPLLVEGRLGRLVVVDAEGRAVGVLSKTDLVREFERLHERGAFSGRPPRLGSDGGS
ncbi:MAG: M50 family metallopeptidase [Trueperaceae bacterium]